MAAGENSLNPHQISPRKGMHRSSTPNLDPTPIAEQLSIVARIPAQDNLVNPAILAVTFDRRINRPRWYFMLNLKHVFLKKYFII